MLLTKEVSYLHLNKDYFVNLRLFQWAQKKRQNHSFKYSLLNRKQVCVFFNLPQDTKGNID